MTQPLRRSRCVPQMRKDGLIYHRRMFQTSALNDPGTNLSKAKAVAEAQKRSCARQEVQQTDQSTHCGRSYAVLPLLSDCQG
jgi:hypothetical protein